MHLCKEVRGCRENPGYRPDKRHSHETEVKAITEALSRLNQSCEVHIHCEDTFVVNMIDYRIYEWAGNDFRKTNGKPIANAEGWQKLWKKMQGHLIRMEKGRHAYSDEIRKMIEE